VDTNDATQALHFPFSLEVVLSVDPSCLQSMEVWGA